MITLISDIDVFYLFLEHSILLCEQQIDLLVLINFLTEPGILRDKLQRLIRLLLQLLQYRLPIKRHLHQLFPISLALIDQVIALRQHFLQIFADIEILTTELLMLQINVEKDLVYLLEKGGLLCGVGTGD
jgi:hypothetical protein